MSGHPFTVVVFPPVCPHCGEMHLDAPDFMMGERARELIHVKPDDDVTLVNPSQDTSLDVIVKMPPIHWITAARKMGFDPATIAFLSLQLARDMLLASDDVVMVVPPKLTPRPVPAT